MLKAYLEIWFLSSFVYAASCGNYSDPILLIPDIPVMLHESIKFMVHLFVSLADKKVHHEKV